MITAKIDTIDGVVGLELGANDYITKPFHVREALARIRAVPRRYAHEPIGHAKGGSFERFEFDGWLLDLARRDTEETIGRSLRADHSRIRASSPRPDY
jgi:DNA-binding response OmpR family regulator